VRRRGPPNKQNVKKQVARKEKAVILIALNTHSEEGGSGPWREVVVRVNHYY
jgi:hypothetical protein